MNENIKAAIESLIISSDKLISEMKRLRKSELTDDQKKAKELNKTISEVFEMIVKIENNHS